MSKGASLTKEQGKKYTIGSKSEKSRTRIMNLFHKEVVRQILLGNKVLLPGDMTIEIIKHKHEATRTGLIKQQPRFGFNYKVRFSYPKLKKKKVKFTASSGIEKKLLLILKETDFEYKLVNNGWQ